MGRGREQARLAAVVDEAVAGRAQVLLLVGDAGIGKTALLQDTLRRCVGRGLRTSYTVAVESEQSMPGAGISLLAAHLTDAAACLGPDMGTALARAAAGVVDDRAPATVLSLLAAAAELGPTVLAVDDVQWWDPPSRRALLFAVRRLLADPMAVLFAGRPSCEDDATLAGLPRLTIDRLDERDAVALVRETAPGTSVRVAGRVAAPLAGNPLALVETARALTPEVASGLRPLPDPLPVGGGVRDRWAREVGALPERARRALLVLAADQTGSADVVRVALTADGVSEADLVPAETCRLVQLDPDGARFRHPLVRAAVLDAVEPTQRRRANAALAAALDGGPHVAEHARHLAASTPGADAAVADRLADDSRRLEATGALLAAAQVSALAARLAPDPDTRGNRMLRAAGLALRADELSAAADLAAEGSHPDLPRPVRGGLLRVQGVAVGLTRSIREGTALLRGAVDLLDGQDRAEAVLDLATLLGFRTDAPEALALLDREVPVTDTPRGAGVRGDVLCHCGRWSEGAPLLRRWLAAADPLDDDAGPMDDEEWFGACTLLGLDETRDQMHRVSDAQVASDRPRRVLSGLFTRAIVSYFEGRWDVTEDSMEEHRRLTSALGQVDYYSDAMVGDLVCRQGDLDRLEATQRSAREIFERTDNPMWAGMEDGQLGLWLVSSGDLTAAEPLLRSAAGAAPAGLSPHNSYADFTVMLVELLARTGRTPEARSLAARVREGLRDAPSQLARGWVERAAAAVAEGTAAEDHFRAAIEAMDCDVHAFALAETRLYYGQWLRRRRRRAEAVGVLRQSLEAFEALGCRPWAATCRDELAAAGVDVVRQERYDPAASLTAQERHVAATVASGMSNAEAARRLFLSPKTVEVHLTHVYRKLGIEGRGQLAAALNRTVAVATPSASVVDARDDR